MLETFYPALLRDGDLVRAAAFVARDFHLRPTPIVGMNINTARADPFEVAEALDEMEAAFDPRPASGPALELLAEVHANRGGHELRYPFEHWSVDSVDVAPDGLSAHAVTEDASCGLVREGSEWRLLWLWR